MSEFFATFYLRSKTEIQLVLHRGAKKTKKAPVPVAIPDPSGLMRRLAPDRALISLGSGAAIGRNTAPLEAILRAWIRNLPR